MSNSLRRLKRQQDRESNELPPSEQKLPTGRVVGAPVRGKHLSFPLLGWISVRERDRIPLVMLALALVDVEKPEVMRGTLEVELPLYLDTEAATVAALERYGWTGTTWSPGEPPPFGNPGYEELLGGLLEQGAQNLRATLLFAPDPESGDTMTQAVEVTRAQGRFLMPPLPDPAEPVSAEKTKALRDLVLGYRRFFAHEAKADA